MSDPIVIVRPVVRTVTISAPGPQGPAPKSWFGSVTLVAGTATVSLPAITSTAKVMKSRKTAGGTIGDLTHTISAGVSFTVNSASGSDTSVVDYLVVDS